MANSVYQTMKYTWMITTLSSKRGSETSKSIDSMKAGFAYHSLEDPSPGRDYYVVAFKYFGGEKQPHWQEATKAQSDLLEKKDSYRYYTPLTFERIKNKEKS